MKSKKRRLQLKCDRLLQEIWRKENPKCEVCGKPTQVSHHFITKGSCSALRYDFDNLIPLCNGCHMKIHQGSDSEIIVNIKDKRGDEWFKELQRKRWKTVVKTDIKYYEDLIIELTNRLNQ